MEKLPDHPNLVRSIRLNLNTHVHDYIIMERCDGGNLKQFLERELETKSDPISEAEITEFLRQFVNGYAELHRLGIIHSDLKPDNILIHNGVYKIADFGLATFLKFQG